MADTGESYSPSSSKPVDGKPVVVRLKRKASQSRLDGLWLEITERPAKRPLLDFRKLSISGSTGKDELKTKKFFVQHVETVSSSEAAVDILHSFVPESSDASGFRTKIEERRRTFKQENKRDQLLSRDRQKHEVLAKNARFEQIWKSRKENKEIVIDDSLREICHLYDVVRVEAEEEASIEVEEQMDTSLEDNAILCNYLPLIREFLPTAAAEIENDIQAYMSKRDSTDGYVYDLYTVNDNPDTADDVSDAYPLVQVDDDEDFYDGQSQSENESDDSNAEDNPLNEYPDEETSEEDESHSHSEVEDESSLSGNQSEHQSEDADALYEEVFVDDDLGCVVNYEDDDNDKDEDVDEDWRWGYR